MEPPPTDPLSEPRAAESTTARAEDLHIGPVLGYAARPAGARRIWRWIRPGSVLFFVLVTALAAGAGWGAWKWRVAADRKAFEASVTTGGGGPLGTSVLFTRVPSRAALRHLSRLPGPVSVYMEWPEGEDAAQAFGAADLGNVSMIGIGSTIDADLLLKELSRPDSGLKSLTTLYLARTKVTDAALKEMSRPDSGLKALDSLNLVATNVTDAGLKEMSRPDSGLKALAWLNLDGTKVSDAGLKELTRPDSGLKALTTLNLAGTKVTDAGIKALQSARPGLTISH